MIYEIDLEKEKCTAESALKSFEFQAATIRARGGRLIIIKHGDKKILRRGLRRLIDSYIKKGNASMVVFGKNFKTSEQHSKYLIDKNPELAEASELDSENDYITILYY